MAEEGSGMKTQFQGKRVFLTGHTGFKGSWTSLWLSQMGAQVYGYALDPPTNHNNFTSSQVASRLAADTRADLSDFDQLQTAIDQARPDVILHMAAQPIVNTALADPRSTYQTNVMGTVNLLEAVRVIGRPCHVIVITSDKCYRDLGENRPYKEDDPLGGNDPYSASKGATEVVAHSYRASYFPPASLQEHGISLATARAGNVIGGGDWGACRIVPDLCAAFHRGDMLQLRMPHAIRPWQHVLEPVSGYLHLAAEMIRRPSPRWCQAWNFGPEDESAVTVERLVREFSKAWNGGGWENAIPDEPLRESVYLRLNNSKAKRELGWFPRWSLQETVERTVRWYKRFHLDPSQIMLASCLEDLEAYQETQGILV